MSPATGRLYPLTMICRGLEHRSLDGLPRHEERGYDESREPKKRGPKTELNDEALVEEIRQLLEESDWGRRGTPEGEGTGCGPTRIWVGKNRVLRLMRENRTPGAGA